MSRTVNGERLFGSREKEMLRRMLHRIADFSGVQILTYCLMDNHFHILVRVPRAVNVTDDELVRRYRVLYPSPTPYQTASVATLERELHSNTEEAKAIRAKLLARMGDVSAFMKTLKQRFSTWFNKTHDRYGPLWSDRFKSILVEGRGNALQTMAAYIDLNPVRAGLVEDPKDYRFCGYAEAVGGHKRALQALKFLVSGLQETSKPEALAAYREMLFGKGSSPTIGGAAIDRKSAARVLETEQGYLPRTVLLRCRIRYFTEGAILGSQEFVQSHTAQWRLSTGRKFRPKPKTIHTKEAPEGLSVMKRVRGPAFS
jgi:REP element-mobilizing transposase RayT